MLTPEYLQQITEGAEELSSTLHANIMDKIISRIMERLGRGEDYIFTQTDKWQIDVLQDAGILLSEIQKEISDITKKQEKEIKEAMQDAGIKTIEYDDKIYQDAGISTKPLAQSPTIIRLLERNYSATAGEWRNFTRTTATDVQRTFINAMDDAYNMVTSGAVSYSEAVADAIKKVSSDGLKVRYPSGREMTIESATMMIVRTGISQASGDVTTKRMLENGARYVLTSSHLGARPTHEPWQGKVFSVDWNKVKQINPNLFTDINEIPETDTKYPDFVESTRYGHIDGILGANCRHSISPYYPGISSNPFEHYDSEENRKAYEQQQRQRTLERRIRDTKRQVQNMQTAVDNCKDERLKFELQNELDRKSYLLKKQNAQYKEYCDKNNLKQYYERLKIAKWDRQQAAKAAGAAKRYENSKIN